jgi:hypothetical protein
MSKLVLHEMGTRYMAQIGRIIVLFGVEYDEAVRLYRRGQRVKRRRWDDSMVPYRSSHK